MVQTKHCDEKIKEYDWLVCNMRTVFYVSHSFCRYVIACLLVLAVLFMIAKNYGFNPDKLEFLRSIYRTQQLQRSGNIFQVFI